MTDYQRHPADPCLALPRWRVLLGLFSQFAASAQLSIATRRIHIVVCGDDGFVSYDYSLLPGVSRHFKDMGNPHERLSGWVRASGQVDEAIGFSAPGRIARKGRHWRVYLKLCRVGPSAWPELVLVQRYRKSFFGAKHLRASSAASFAVTPLRICGVLIFLFGERRHQIALRAKKAGHGQAGLPVNRLVFIFPSEARSTRINGFWDSVRWAWSGSGTSRTPFCALVMTRRQWLARLLVSRSPSVGGLGSSRVVQRCPMVDCLATNGLYRGRTSSSCRPPVFRNRTRRGRPSNLLAGVGLLPE